MRQELIIVSSENMGELHVGKRFMLKSQAKKEKRLALLEAS